VVAHQVNGRGLQRDFDAVQGTECHSAQQSPASRIIFVCTKTASPHLALHNGQSTFHKIAAFGLGPT
jgi:hypothetical protein